MLHLGLYFRLHLGEGDGPEVVVVHAYVVLQREQHLQARNVQAGVGPRPAVDVPEELPDVPVGAAVAEEGIVVQDYALPADADGHLLGHEFEALHETLLDALHVMITENKVYLPVEPVDDVVPVAGISHA